MADPVAPGAFRVAVVGEALIDRFPDGDVIGGAPFNVARNLALFGVEPLMLTRIGADPLGQTIEADFARCRLDARGLQRDSAHPTGTVAVRLQVTGHRFEIGADAAWDHLDAEQAVAAVRAAAPAIVYFGTLAQREATSRTAIRGVLAATGALPFLDLNLRDGPDNRALALASLGLARQLKVNDDELDHLLHWFGDGDGDSGNGSVPSAVTDWGDPAQRRAVEALAVRFGLERVTITRGAAGWAAFDPHGIGWIEGRAPAVRVRDTVGAGDAFASVLLLGELAGWPLPVTLDRASAHASAVCGLQGAVDATGAIYRSATAAWAAEDRKA